MSLVGSNLLTPNFNTYKLASEPIFERVVQADVPGGGTRPTIEYVHLQSLARPRVRAHPALNRLAFADF